MRLDLRDLVDEPGAGFVARGGRSRKPVQDEWDPPEEVLEFALRCADADKVRASEALHLGFSEVARYLNRNAENARKWVVDCWQKKNRKRK